MNPGLVVKLRPTGPWRIGPDSGARNRVDVVYHSDSLYSAMTAAMARLGSLEDWLDATARSEDSAVSIGSCFPYVNETGYVIPPRTVWPPASASATSARVRWKSARFVPIEVVQAILAGRKLNDNQWTVDGPSECLVPAGTHGPFRTGVRWNAAIDRLTGAVERHSTACIEFRSGCGLWTVISFRDEAAHARWSEPVKAAFRLLADTGFGGERSRGWGRSDTPEFIEGTLPDMVLPAPIPGETVVDVLPAGPEEELPVVPEAPAEEVVTPRPEVDEILAAALAADAAERAAEIAPEREPSETSEPAAEAAPAEAPPAEHTAEEKPEPAAPEEPGGALDLEGEPDSGEASVGPPSPVQPLKIEPPSGNGSEPTSSAVAEPQSALAVMEMEEPVAVEEEPATVEPVPEPLEEPIIAAHPGPAAHWLLSLFAPAAADSVDWSKGNYTVLARGGRIDSPAGSGELKKQIQMVAEGSVIYAESAPRGSAANVAPDGFAHPVYRAGFALAIPLPEVR